MNGAVKSFAACVALAIAASPRVAAIERMPLPVLQLSTVDGAVVTTDRIAKSGRWLMIYVQSDCSRCDTLLRQVVMNEPAALSPRVVIVVGAASTEAVRTTIERFPELAGATWLVDATAALNAPLRIDTAPVVFGLDGRMIAWSLPSVLAGSPEMASVLAHWTAR